MGTNGYFLIVQSDLNKDDIAQAILDAVVPKITSKPICFHHHDIPSSPVRLLSFDLDDTRDFELIGTNLSEALSGSVWIVVIIDAAGVDAAWRFDEGRLVHGYADQPEVLTPEGSFPSTTETDTPIETCFADSPFSFLNRRKFDDLLFEDRGAEPIYVSEEYESFRKRERIDIPSDTDVKEKKWWQFWM